MTLVLDPQQKYFDEVLSKIIFSDKTSDKKAQMQVAKDYYRGRHDILDYRLFYVNNDGQMVEETNRSNVQIPHQFFTELVDQKTNYLLSNPIEFKTENAHLAKRLEEYIDDEFQLTIQDLVEGAAINGYEVLYYYFKDNDDKIYFQAEDSFNLIFVKNEYEKIKYVIRYYDTKTYNAKGQQQKVEKVDLFDDEKVITFTKNSNKYEQDGEPRYYRALEVDGTIYPVKERFIPFLVLENNRNRTSDLEPIKLLIDDYDLMASALTNNLIDFDHPIYAVRGFQGDNLDDLVRNLATRKTIGVGDDGGLDVKTIDIPVEARKTKLEIDRKSIYKFGMGFDSDIDTGDRALTNIGIKSRYSLLDIKCNKLEVRLRSLLQSVLELILKNIKERCGEEYDVSEIEIIITREAMTNDKERAEEEQLRANALASEVSAIMNASLALDSDEVIKLLADAFELDYEYVKLAMDETPVPPLDLGDYDDSETE